MIYKHIKLLNIKITTKSETGYLQALVDFTWTDFIVTRLTNIWSVGVHVINLIDINGLKTMAFFL